MRDIFSDLYKKVFGFFQKNEKTEDNAKDVACNRLKLVLMQDRTNLNPQLLERMRGEMIELLSKYVEMDKDALELNFEQEGEQMALMLSIPVVRAKDEEEIEKALKEEDEAKNTSNDKEENKECDCEECDCENCDEKNCECRDCEKESCEECEIAEAEAEKLDVENTPTEDDCVVDEEVNIAELEEVKEDKTQEIQTDNTKQSKKK